MEAELEWLAKQDFEVGVDNGGLNTKFQSDDYETLRRVEEIGCKPC